MKKFTLLFLLTSLLLVSTSCDDDSDLGGSNDAGFEYATKDYDLEFADTYVSLMVELTTTSVSSAPRFLDVSVLAGSTASPDGYEVPTVIRIPENSSTAYIPVQIKDPSGSIFPSEEEFSLLLELDESTAVQTQTEMKIKRKPCSFPKVELDLVFDNYGSEVSWKIRDSSNTVVSSGGSYADGDVSHAQPFCLSNGTYTFELFDSYGDGLASPGYAKITVDGTEVVFIDGNFGKTASEDFTF